MIKFECPHCGNGIKVNDSAAGKSGKCNQCGEKVTVPHSTAVVKTSPEIVHDAPPPAQYRQQQTAPQQPTVAVQVNQKERPSNSVGIASVILGILALLICWIPLVNIISLILGGIGLLLAGIGLFLGLSRKGSGIGFPIAGGAVSVISMSVAGAMLFAMFSAAGGVRAVQQARAAAKQAKEKQTTGAVASDVPPVNVWDVAGTTADAGEFSLKILSVEIGPVEFERGGQTEDDFLKIKYQIHNNSDVKKIDFYRWGDRQSDTLSDEFGNTYSSRFNSVSGVKDKIYAIEEIYPEATAIDTFIFDLPVKKATELRLKLGGLKSNGYDPVRFKFPAPKVE